MARAEVTVHVADLPEVKAFVRSLETERDDLRSLLRMWEPRVVCPQCGNRYLTGACGPTHALIRARVEGPSENQADT